MKLYRPVCDIHAPRFWESEPPPRFAHTPLPKSIQSDSQSEHLFHFANSGGADAF